MASVKSKISIFAVVLFALLTSATSLGTLSVNAQTENTKPSYTVLISKDANAAGTIADGATYTSGFDTTYDIKGTTLDFSKGRDLIISTIIDDFDNSSTIGYIRAGNAESEASSNATGTEAHPFVTVEQINEKIKSVLGPTIDGSLSGSGVQFTVGPVTHEIKCNFGGHLEDFGCFKVEGFKLDFN
jgi:hypothetical protein